MSDLSADATAPRVGVLPVPGATLRYEVRGTGPLLLLIPGGAGNADVFHGVAPVLADRFTVASYAPRGISGSPLDSPGEEEAVEVHAADARRLLDLLSPDEPATVLGTSSGAVAAVELLTRHPERLRLVVAHEPPLIRVLPDPHPVLAAFAGIQETAVREGVGAAYARMGAVLGAPEPVDDPAVGDPAPVPDGLRAAIEASSAHFLRNVLRSFSHHAPDLTELKGVADRLVVAVGRASRGQLQHTMATALAEAVGAECREFPGGHVGCVEHPAAFAQALAEALPPTGH
ncbi:alpha/beta hydrolase [Streptomyces tubbatahanensis]|uniref:Alpha/beta hydrolase n=1 Tax=Streptomyces tubbatahanensis TaxID=2923272 RepID=A0ABY3XW86_9ACTN|nr:alpha/beta hydrolase [Streptomyces tubbatahanensis]UNS98657.1 alpha/beta hydrolase [Streptomyces tubbatahanensis]